jgi:hypothetical protein
MVSYQNGNTFWADAIAKEMKDICIAFKILLDRQYAPIGSQRYPATEFLTSTWKTFDAKPD